ncbi:hypothetical protein KC360_g1 [Hortaea werneckii]|nr:hypothetical protein KC344_g1 [Hortaea werneckii]KAI7180380.1 hypothetical protein KC360_g1 [Hortaea werneckii]
MDSAADPATAAALLAAGPHQVGERPPPSRYRPTRQSSPGVPRSASPCPSAGSRRSIAGRDDEGGGCDGGGDVVVWWSSEIGVMLREKGLVPGWWIGVGGRPLVGFPLASWTAGRDSCCPSVGVALVEEEVVAVVFVRKDPAQMGCQLGMRAVVVAVVGHIHQNLLLLLLRHLLLLLCFRSLPAAEEVVAESRKAVVDSRTLHWLLVLLNTLEKVNEVELRAAQSLKWFAILLRILFGQILPSVVDQAGGCVLDLRYLQTGGVLKLPRNAEVLNDLVCLFAKDLVDPNRSFGIRLGHFKVVTQHVHDCFVFHIVQIQQISCEQSKCRQGYLILNVILQQFRAAAPCLLIFSSCDPHLCGHSRCAKRQSHVPLPPDSRSIFVYSGPGSGRRKASVAFCAPSLIIRWTIISDLKATVQVESRNRWVKVRKTSATPASPDWLNLGAALDGFFKVAGHDEEVERGRAARAGGGGILWSLHGDENLRRDSKKMILGGDMGSRSAGWANAMDGSLSRLGNIDIAGV